MSVLEKFFQIGMFFLIVTIGINMMITTFGEPMTGLNLTAYADVNASSWQQSDFPNVISQTGSSPTDLPAAAASTLVSPFTDKILQSALGLQMAVYTILTGYGLETLALALNGFISTFQLIGLTYLFFSFIAILRGSGGAP